VSLAVKRQVVDFTLEKLSGTPQVTRSEYPAILVNLHKLEKSNSDILGNRGKTAGKRDVQNAPGYLTNGIYTKFSRVGGNGCVPLDNLIFTLLPQPKQPE
jgi:hypothetical protein